MRRSAVRSRSAPPFQFSANLHFSSDFRRLHRWQNAVLTEKLSHWEVAATDEGVLFGEWMLRERKVAATN
jgi:hypothetical protein